jgi:hypothetical protein
MQSGPSDANVSVVSGEHEMKRVIEDCEEPTLGKLVKKIQILTLSACTVQGCILETRG